MKPRVLFIITSDPRTSPRTAEAVRIATGVGVWQRADIQVYLRAEAVLALGESGSGLVAENDYAQYWPMLAESGRPIYVQKNAAALRQLGPAAVPFTEISDGQLAELAAGQNCVIRF
jgi:sulfur relay (sulfurtransferase) DsrF/TusC family protein